ncbi:hypothetical protein D3C78_1588780 [compost metagenome]
MNDQIVRTDDRTKKLLNVFFQFRFILALNLKLSLYNIRITCYSTIRFRVKQFSLWTGNGNILNGKLWNGRLHQVVVTIYFLLARTIASYKFQHNGS